MDWIFDDGSSFEKYDFITSKVNFKNSDGIIFQNLDKSNSSQDNSVLSAGFPCLATFTNDGSNVGVLWQYYGDNKWSSNYITIQPGVTHTQFLDHGEIWEVWNQADDTRFAAFTIDCYGSTQYSFSNGGIYNLMFNIEGEPIVSRRLIVEKLY